MNTDRLSRCTFVIDRETADALTYIARRFGRSRSWIVRDVLRDPVRVMAYMVDGSDIVPGDPPDSSQRLVQLALQAVDDYAEEARVVIKGSGNV